MNVEGRVNSKCAGGLAETRHEISNLQMRVLLQHLQFFMSADRADFCDVQAALEQSRDYFMAQIVKVQVGAASEHADAPKRAARRCPS